MPNALAEGSAQRFRDSIAALTGGTGRIGLAVSGGPDSLALMVLAHATMPDWIRIATVDHQLRTESADEARFVAQLCAERGLAHDMLIPRTSIAGSVQASARSARYDTLDAWATEHELAWIATAHHIDDQAETLLMRLARGSGIAGLSGIRARSGMIIRPLLGWRRAELRAVVEQAGIVPVDDPSNHDEQFDRVRLRRWMAAAQAPDAAPIAASAALIAGANEALDWAAQQEAMRRLTRDDHGVAVDANGLPGELCHRLTLIALRMIAPDCAPRGRALSDTIAALTRGERTTLGGVLCSGGAIWHFAAAPPRAQPSDR